MKAFSYQPPIFFVILLLFCAIRTSAQVSGSPRINTDNTNAWLMYFGSHQFSERIGLHAEVQWRRNELLSNPQQLLLRTGVEFFFSNSNRLTIGYAFIDTHPYGDFAAPNSFPEHRIWQQFLTTQTMNRFKLSHRFRLEQRNIGNAATGEFKGGRYENRFRYMAKLTYGLTPSWEKPAFAAVYNEVFLNFGKEVGYNLFDQNRLYGAIGFTLAKDLKLELGYLYQAVQLRSLDTSAGFPRSRIENNHTLQLGLFSSMPFYRKDAE